MIRHAQNRLQCRARTGAHWQLFVPLASLLLLCLLAWQPQGGQAAPAIQGDALVSCVLGEALDGSDPALDVDTDHALVPVLPFSFSADARRPARGPGGDHHLRCGALHPARAPPGLPIA